MELTPKPFVEWTDLEKVEAFNLLRDYWYDNAESGNLIQQMLATQYIRQLFDENY